MEVLGEVHSLDLTFVDATPSSSPEIIWLQERMYDDSRNTSWKSNKTENESWFVFLLPLVPLDPSSELTVAPSSSPGNFTTSPLLLPNSYLLRLPPYIPTPAPFSTFLKPSEESNRCPVLSLASFLTSTFFVGSWQKTGERRSYSRMTSI